MKRALISLILRISGNVNADESMGSRITIKKMVSTFGEVLPFVSARAIRRSIRERLMEKGHEIDPLNVEGEGKKARLFDIGDPIKYTDDDIFGYLAIKKKRAEEGGEGIPRISPIKVSYLVALKHTEISVERGGRFPRPHTEKEAYPTPFEVEVADFYGKLNVIVEDRIGVFAKGELKDDIINKYIKDKKLIEKHTEGNKKYYELPIEERKRRLNDFLQILLKEGWLYPRASRSLNIVDYYYAVIVLSEKLIPIFGCVDLTEDRKIDQEKISNMLRLLGEQQNDVTLYIVDYKAGKILKFEGESFKDTNKSIDDLINEIINYLIPQPKSKD